MNTLMNSGQDSKSSAERRWASSPDAIQTWSVARTNVQLYNQLIGQGRPLDELVLIRDAYQLAMKLY